jgi:hypothetical protein
VNWRSETGQNRAAGIPQLKFFLFAGSTDTAAKKRFFLE